MEKELRVTTDADFFEEHADSVELWSPGSPTFPDPALLAGDIVEADTTTPEALDLSALLGVSKAPDVWLFERLDYGE